MVLIKILQMLLNSARYIAQKDLVRGDFDAANNQISSNSNNTIKTYKSILQEA